MRFVIYEIPEGVWFVLEDEGRPAMLVSRLFYNHNWCKVAIQAVVRLMSGANLQRKTFPEERGFPEVFSQCVYRDREGFILYDLVTGSGNTLAQSRRYATTNAYNEEIVRICRRIRIADVVRMDSLSPDVPAPVRRRQQELA